MTGTGEALPEELEDRLYSIHFEADAADRTERIEDLCRAHPEHAAVLRRRGRALARSDRVLGRVHDELHGVADRERVGPFEIERVLGEGGFGTVYLAQQHEPVRRKVALKVLQAGRGDTRSRQRFEDERQLLARLQHACIAQVYDAGVTDDRQQYFAMEYVDGAPITTWCREHRADVDARLRLFLRVCAAIHHAHQREVVHRDIKPSNVLVREEDGAPLPKVIDFGIAKLLACAVDPAAPELTLHGGQIGTPGYMSPEQAAGDPVDTRTDVYSLGVLLCELLTGALPIARDELASRSFPAIARLLAEQAPRRPSSLLDAATAPAELLARLRDDLDWIVLKAVAVDREERYSTVAALAEDVERHLRRQPVHARQRATAYVVRKFVRRHRVAVAVALLVLTSLVAAVASLSWGLDIAEQARGEAEHDRDVARARERAARMAVAQLALTSGDVQTARDNLLDIAPDRRGWEWRHLAAQSDTSLGSFPIDTGGLAILWLDEHRVATFPMYAPPTVWDVRTGAATHTDVWEGTFRRVAFDRARRQAIVVGDEGVGLWDTARGMRLRGLGRPPGEPFGVSWSEDRRTVAVSGRGRWADVIDVATGRRLRRLKLAQNAAAIALVGDDAVAVAYEQGAIEVLARADGRVLAAMRGHSDAVDHLLHDPRRDRLYSSSIDGTVRVWRASDGAAVATIPCNVRMRRLLLSDDGSVLYACGGWTDCMLAAWETATLRALGTFAGHRRGVGDVTFSPDGARIASVSRDETVRIWPRLPTARAVRLEAGRDARVLSADAAGARFGAASFDGRVTVWDAKSLEPVLSLRTDEVWTGSALGADTFYVVGNLVRAYAVATGDVVAEGTIAGRRVENMAVDPDERWLVGGHHDHVLVWRLPSLELAHDLALPVGPARLAWDPETSCFAIAGDAATVFWLDPEAGAVRRESVVGDTDHRVGALALRDDLLATGAGDELLVRRGDRELHRIHTLHVSAAIWPDGERLVTGGHDKKVRVWDLATGDQLLVFDEPEYPAEGVAVVDGGNRVVALSHRWYAPSYLYVWSAPEAVDLGR